MPCACINNCNWRQVAIKEKELLYSYVLKYQTKHLNYPALQHATAGLQPCGCEDYHGWFNGGQFGKVGLHWLLFVYVYKGKHRLAPRVWFHSSMMILIDSELCGFKFHFVTAIEETKFLKIMGAKYATNFEDGTVLLILPIEYPVDSYDMEIGFSTRPNIAKWIQFFSLVSHCCRVIVPVDVGVSLPHIYH